MNGFKSDEEYMSYAILNAESAVAHKTGGPFGAVVIGTDGHVIGSGFNTVILEHDPTAHAEMNSIRDACNHVGTHDLSGCKIFTTSYPCPMCLAAIKWANIGEIYYGCTVEDAEAIGFRDKEFFEQPGKIKIHEFHRDNCLKVFQKYSESDHKLY